jgi:hypothetical protein
MLGSHFHGRMSIPTLEDLEEVGVSTLTEFYERIGQSDDDELQARVLKMRASSENILVPRTQALEAKLDLALPYFFSHLACNYKNGILPAGHGMPKMDLSKYMGAEQFERYIKKGKSPDGMRRLVR